jgi:uncharacterized protein (TIGR00290 family)
MRKAFINWIGGKNSTMALHHILKESIYSVQSLFTSISKPTNRVPINFIRNELITKQRFSLNIASRKIFLPENITNENYNALLNHELSIMKEKGITNAVYGDILLEEFCKYHEAQLNKLSMNAVFPLHNKDTKEIMNEFISLGYKAIVVCVNAEKLDKTFAGRILDNNFLNDLPANVDACGDNGEFHTFVYDGPIFKAPINFLKGELLFKENIAPEQNTLDKGTWVLDLLSE